MPGRRTRRAGLVAAILLIVSVGAPTAADATAIGAGEHPDTVMDRDGVTHVVWNESRDAADALVYCRIPAGATACGDVRSFVPAAGAASNTDFVGPHVRVTPFGEVVLLTSRCCGIRPPGHGSGTANVVYVSDDDGATFGPPEVVGFIPSGAPAAPAPIVFDAADRRVVTIEGRTGAVAVSGQPLGTLTTGAAVLATHSGYEPSIAQRGPGSFVASWTDLAGTAYVRTFDCAGCPLTAINDASRWSPAVAIPDVETTNLASGPLGTFLFTADRDPADPARRRWVVRRIDAATPGPPIPVSEGGISSPWRDFRQEPGGRLHAVYRDAGVRIAYRSSGDGVTWTTPVVLTAGPDFSLQFPRVAARALDSGPRGVAIWLHQPGGLTNPAVHSAALPDPATLPLDVPPPPPAPPPPAPPPPPGPAPPPSAPPARPCQLLTLGPVDAIADDCFRVSGSVSVATGGVRLNGLRITVDPGATLRFDRRARTVRSSGRATIRAGDTVLYRGTISWTLPAGSTADVGELRVGSFGGKLLGFPLAGTTRLKLVRGAAELPLHVRLPPIFGGVTGDLTLRVDNLSGVRVRNLRVRVGNAFLGPLQVKDLRFAYDADERTWSGGAELILPPQPPGPSLASHIGFRDGELDFLRNELKFPGVGIPLDPLSVVYLQSIRFRLETRPALSLSGGVGLSAGPRIGSARAIGIDGDLTWTFPDPPRPAILRADGTVSLVEIPLSNAYVEARTNGYVAFGGAVGFEESGFVVKAQIDGWLQGSTFNAEARARLCLGDLGCQRGEVVISSRGFAGCVKTDLADFGAGARWGQFPPTPMLTGCDIGPYRAQAAQTGVPPTTVVAPGTRGIVVGVRGVGAPPAVALTGPRGRRIVLPTGGPLRSAGAIAFRVAEQATTWFVVRAPAAGTWRVEPLPGSAPVSGLRRADVLPDPAVAATVGGRGRARTLRYEVRPLPGQRIRFTEVGGRVARTLGEARGPRGTIRFRPADGPGGRRRVIAQVQSHGTPRDVLRVASYVAPPPVRAGRPRRLRLRRSGTRLIVSFSPSARAVRQRVRVRLSDGRRLILPLGRRARRVTIRGVARRTTGTVTVVGVRADGAPGPAATARLRARRTTPR